MTRSEFLLLCYHGTAEEAANAYETLRRDHELLLQMSNTASQSQLQFAVDVEKKIKTLETELAKEREHSYRLFQDRYALLNATTTEGLSAAEWQMRTATAEAKVVEAEKTIRLLRSQLHDMNQDLEDAEGRYR